MIRKLINMIRKLINKLFIEVPETQSLSDIAVKEKEQNFTKIS